MVSSLAIDLGFMKHYTPTSSNDALYAKAFSVHESELNVLSFLRTEA